MAKVHVEFWQTRVFTLPIEVGDDLTPDEALSAALQKAEAMSDEAVLAHPTEADNSELTIQHLETEDGTEMWPEDDIGGWADE